METMAGPAISQRLLYFCLRRLNPFMKRLLRSRLHRLVSGTILLVTFTGRHSGKRYTTPVSYIREQETVTFATPRACRWWVNIRTGATVTLLIAGREHSGQAVVVADDQAEKVIRIRRLLELVPRDARYYPVAIDPRGIPDPVDLERAAREHIVVLVRLPAEQAPRTEKSTTSQTHSPPTSRSSR